MVRKLVAASAKGQGPEAFALGGAVAELDRLLGDKLDGMVKFKIERIGHGNG